MTHYMDIGGSHRIDLTLKNDDGTPRDLTGATVTIKAYSRKDKLSLVLTGSATISNGSSGKCSVSFSVAQNTMLQYAVLWMVVKVVESDGTTTEVLRDTLIVS